MSPGCHRHTSVPLGTLGGAMGRRSSHAPLPGNACRRLRMRGAGRFPARTTSPGVLCGGAVPACSAVRPHGGGGGSGSGSIAAGAGRGQR